MTLCIITLCPESLYSQKDQPLEEQCPVRHQDKLQLVTQRKIRAQKIDLTAEVALDAIVAGSGLLDGKHAYLARLDQLVRIFIEGGDTVLTGMITTRLKGVCHLDGRVD